MQLSNNEKRKMVEENHSKLSIRKQCELLGLSRSVLYYQTTPVPDIDQDIMRLIDEQYLKTPYYGARKMSRWLKSKDYDIGREKTSSLMKKMGLYAIYQKPKISKSHPDHKKYPYLLKGLAVNSPDHVWCTDITYIRMHQGFVYLVAIMDWFSRFVLSWEISNSLDTSFCIEALETALQKGKPKIFNSDQGVQFTSELFTAKLIKNSVKISMDGRGAYWDNIFIERLWRTVKYEEVYIKDYSAPIEVSQNISTYFHFYNHERFHQALNYMTPASLYHAN